LGNCDCLLDKKNLFILLCLLLRFFSDKFVLTKFLSAVLEIDTLGTYTMCYEALKYLKKGGPGKGPSTGGLIINISATLHYSASWYQIHVSAAKVPGSSLNHSLITENNWSKQIRLYRLGLIASQDHWLWSGEQIMTLESTGLHLDQFKTPRG
jgi:hypothetical protein